MRLQVENAASSDRGDKLLINEVFSNRNAYGKILPHFAGHYERLSTSAPELSERESTMQVKPGLP